MTGLYHHLYFTLYGRGGTDLYQGRHYGPWQDHCIRTKDELKQMIKTGETITIEAVILEENNLKEIRELEHVFDIQYRNQILTVRCTRARHNLIRILNYLQNQDIAFGRVFSEMPDSE